MFKIEERVYKNQIIIDLYISKYNIILSFTKDEYKAFKDFINNFIIKGNNNEA